eukprot:7383259-Prymnesium_polylepis.1
MSLAFRNAAGLPDRRRRAEAQASPGVPIAAGQVGIAVNGVRGSTDMDVVAKTISDSSFGLDATVGVLLDVPISHDVGVSTREHFAMHATSGTGHRLLDQWR